MIHSSFSRKKKSQNNTRNKITYKKSYRSKILVNQIDIRKFDIKFKVNNLENK